MQAQELYDTMEMIIQELCQTITNPITSNHEYAILAIAQYDQVQLDLKEFIAKQKRERSCLN